MAETEAEATVQAPVAGYSLVMPTGWRRIPVQHGTRAAIRAIIDEVMARYPKDQPRDKMTPYRIELERREGRLDHRRRRPHRRDPGASQLAELRPEPARAAGAGCDARPRGDRHLRAGLDHEADLDLGRTVLEHLAVIVR